jgi:hypothetical protein
MTAFVKLMNFEKYPLAWKGYAMPEALQDDLNNAAMENYNLKNMVQLSTISTLKLFVLAVKYVKEDAYKPLECENDLEMYFSNYFDPLSITVYIEKDAIDSSILKLLVFDMIANNESFSIIIENVKYIL